MRNSRSASLAVLALLGIAHSDCGTRIAYTTEPPPPGLAEAGAAGTEAGASGGGMPYSVGGDEGTPSAPCAATLSGRLTISSIEVDEDIRYKQQGYNRVPVDRRIAFAVQRNGASRVAWLDNDLSHVHVTPLSSAQVRIGADLVLEGSDLGGLVAHDDGFAVLTRRTDPGEPLTDPNVGGIAKAAFLVRVREGAEAFAVPLTGTKAITDYPAARRRDCAEPALGGRLAYNEAKYGAYFTVHGCAGDLAASFYADKLVYVDPDGRYVSGGWDWKCSINEGLRLLPEPDVFTALCMSDSQPHPGLVVVTGTQTTQLAAEETWKGYCAGQFGSVLRLANGYLVGWLSRGAAVSTDTGAVRATREAPDIAIARLATDGTPSGAMSWLAETPDIAEANLHLASYGTDRILVVWDTITDLQCKDGTCLGQYAGTHARLMDSSGTFLTPDETIDAPPNGDDNLSVFPNGDVGWAFVAESPGRSYASALALDSDGVPAVPSKREIRVARLRYCPN